LFLLFATERLLSRFAWIRLLAPLQKLPQYLVGFLFRLPAAPGKCPLAVLQSDAPLPADLMLGKYPHHEVIKPWQ